MDDKTTKRLFKKVDEQSTPLLRNIVEIVTEAVTNELEAKHKLEIAALQAEHGKALKAQAKDIQTKLTQLFNLPTGEETGLVVGKKGKVSVPAAAAAGGKKRGRKPNVKVEEAIAVVA